jgi:hypothetical protein
MTTTTFINGTLIEPTWLNDVNTATYTITGTGNAVRATAPTITSPTISSGNVTVSTGNVYVSAGKVGIGTSSPAVSLAISGTDAALIPSGTTAQRPTGATGYIRFNSTTTAFEGYNGTSWNPFNGTVTSVAASVPAFLSISGSPITTSGTLAITLSGTALPVANGGTGLTTLTAGYIPYGNGTSAFSSSSSLYFSGTQLGIGTTTVASGNSVSQSNINANGGGVQIGYPTNGGLLISGLSGSGAIFTKYTGSQGSETYVEAVRLDNSGNWLVGTTGANGKIAAYATSSDANRSVLRADTTNASYGGTHLYQTCSTGLSTGYDFIGSYANGTTAFRVRGDGTVFAQNVLIQSASDIRFKENIVDSTDGLNVITALRPVRFDWKKESNNNKKNQLGFIAQEIQKVFPEAIDVWGESNDPNNPYLSVGSGALIPVLVKALQELNNKFDAYVASHP